MTEYLRQRQTITNPFANRSYQPRPKATPIRRHNVVTPTRPNKEKVSQPRKVNIGPLPEAMQRNWLTMVNAKEEEDTAFSKTPAPTQPAEAPTTQSPTLPSYTDMR